jgi:hypothetical protein
MLQEGMPIRKHIVDGGSIGVIVVQLCCSVKNKNDANEKTKHACILKPLRQRQTF